MGRRLFLHELLTFFVYCDNPIIHDIDSWPFSFLSFCEIMENECRFSFDLRFVRRSLSGERTVFNEREVLQTYIWFISYRILTTVTKFIMDQSNS